MIKPIRSDRPDEIDFPALYSMLIEESKERAVFLMDVEGRIASWNPGVGVLLGYDRESWVGQSASIIFTPEDRAQGEFEREMKEAADRGQASDIRWHLRKDGSRLFVDGLVRALRNQDGALLGFAKLIRDATARKQADEERERLLAAVRAQHEQLTHTLESISDAFYAVDAAFRFTYINQKSEELWNRSREELIGKHLWTEFPQAVGSESHDMHLLVMAERRALSFETVSPIVGRWIEVSLYPERGGGLACYFRDITARKRLEQERRQVTELLAAQAEKLERSNKDLQRFSYVVSHDLQEPLRSLTGFAQMLAKRYKANLGPEAEEFLEHIVSAANRMRGLIDALLGYSRVVNAEPKPFSEVPLDSVLHWATMNLHRVIEETGAEVTVGPLPTVRGDQMQLVQLFQNLLANAIKYRKASETPRIQVAAEERNGDWVVSVQDNGIGIGAPYQERIFEVFKRLHGPEIPGTGIGLAICKRIVESHGGRIWVESEEGRGATFRLTLPRPAESQLRQ